LELVLKSDEEETDGELIKVSEALELALVAAETKVG